MNNSPETAMDVEIVDTVIIADGTGTEASASVDMKQHDSVLWAIEVTDINTTGTLLVTIEDSANDSAWATALQPDGTDAAMASAAIVADGVYYVRALAENMDRYARLSVAVGSVGVDYTVIAIRFGKKVKAAANTLGTVGHLQLGLPA